MCIDVLVFFCSTYDKIHAHAHNSRFQVACKDSNSVRSMTTNALQVSIFHTKLIKRRAVLCSKL